MKYKIALAGALLAISSIASAVEVGVVGSYDYGPSNNRAGGGITIGQKFGSVGLTAGIEQYNKNENQTKMTLVGSVDVAKVLGATIAVKGGAAYLNNSSSADGYAWIAGVGATYPLTKQWALTADYRYQVGQNRVNQFDGNSALFGVKYSF